VNNAAVQGWAVDQYRAQREDEAKEQVRRAECFPDLLEALKHAVDWLNAAGVAASMPVQQQARAAILKAEGEQK